MVLALVLVVAPLRVMGHGRRIRATYGDPAELLGVIESIPGSLDYILRELEKVKLPREGLVLALPVVVLALLVAAFT